MGPERSQRQTFKCPMGPWLTFQSYDLLFGVHDGRVGGDGSADHIIGVSQVDDDHLVGVICRLASARQLSAASHSMVNSALYMAAPQTKAGSVATRGTR